MAMDKQTTEALANVFGIDGTEIRVGFGDYRKPADLPDWYGIPGVKYVSPNNNWADGQLYYEKHLFNSHDVEDAMWCEYNEECDENGSEATDEGFEVFMKDNVDEVYELLDELVEAAKNEEE